MAAPQSLVVNYLDAARLMHLATSSEQGAWCAAVYFAVDNLHSIYWLSDPQARHSRDIATNGKVAAAFTLPQVYEQPQQGLQATGQARLVPLEETERFYESYAERFTAHGLVDDILAGRDSRRLYQLTPESFILYDEKFFPNEPRQEWRLDGSSPVSVDDPQLEQEQLAIIDQEGQADHAGPEASADNPQDIRPPAQVNQPQVPPVIAPDHPRSLF